MSKPEWNVGIVGYGLSAKIFHIPFVSVTKGLKLHSVYQRTPNENDNPSGHHPGVQLYRDINSFLSDGRLEVVVITTPPLSHFELTKAAILAGKHGMSSPAITNRQCIDSHG